jgi:hypothetical protein
MKDKIVRHSMDEINKMKGKTKFKKVSETSDKDIEDQVSRDPDSVLPNDDELEEFKPVNKGGKNEK